MSLKKILIIDDDPDTVSYIEKCIHPEFLVSKAYNGRDGIARVMNGDIDLILLDIIMSKMDGVEFCDAPKALGADIVFKIQPPTAEEIGKMKKSWQLTTAPMKAG